MVHLVFSGQANRSILKGRIIHSIDAFYCAEIDANVYGDHYRAHKCRPGRNAAIVLNRRLKRCFKMFPLSVVLIA
jgi:hypothetical protein